MSKYFIKYGIYLDRTYDIIEADSLEEADNYAYEQAYDVAEQFAGLHGFCVDDDGEELEGEERHEEIEQHLDWSAELYTGTEEQDEFTE